MSIRIPKITFKQTKQVATSRSLASQSLKESLTFNVFESISAKLLKNVFGAYCLVALIATVLQVVMEYKDSKEHVHYEIETSENIFSHRLEKALWRYDIASLDKILTDVMANHVITGVSITTASGEVVLQKGIVADSERAWPQVTLESASLSIAKPTFASSMFEHKAPLFSPGGTQNLPIGYARFYTSRDMVIAETGHTFIVILLVAFIKTFSLWVLFLYFGKKLLSRPLNKLVNDINSLPLSLCSDALKPSLAKKNEIELVELALEELAKKLNNTLGSLRADNQNLSENNTILQQAIEQSPAAVIIFNAQCEIVYHNSCLSISADSTNEIDSPLYDNQLIMEEVEKIILAENVGRGWRKEFQLTNPNGANSWLSVQLTPIEDVTGNVSSSLFIATDITAQKELEQSLRFTSIEQEKIIHELSVAHKKLLQSEKMASIGQLAAGVAHEINNPVGYINSNINSLSQYTEDLMCLLELYEQYVEKNSSDTEEIRAYKSQVDYEFLKKDIQELLHETTEGVDRVKQIIAALKEFSRDSSDEWHLSDLSNVLESTIKVVTNELKYKADLIKEFSELPEIECIPSQLGQVFLNLLVNASHAIKGYGTITIRTGSTQNEVWIQVKDTGCGIAPENIPNLFDPFFTTKPLGEGTGLGLSISYGIIEKHGGRIDVVSKVGEGTSFYVYLPIRQFMRDDQNQENETSLELQAENI